MHDVSWTRITKNAWIGRAARALTTLIGLLGLWHALVLLLAPPAFILPPPSRVLATLVERRHLLLDHGTITLGEILAGLVLGSILGCLAGLVIAAWPPARRWLQPTLVASQSLPVFTLAPILVLWLGYGFASKVAMAALIIFFPVAVAAQDGLANTPRALIDVARSLGASPLGVLLLVRLPAALPALASGLRIAAAIAPIGAVIGEWVGAAGGLGFVMMQANARMQTDLMFAAVLVLAAIAIALHAAVDLLITHCMPWLAVNRTTRPF